MKILVDGRETEQVPVSDRGLQYGDGLFETIAVRSGRPRLLGLHLERLASGCERLALPCPAAQVLRREVASVIEADEQVVKVVLTRGVAGRGYRVPETASPTRIVMAYPAGKEAASLRAAGVKVRICTTRVATSPALAGLKHLGRLEHVLARSEWRDASIAEGLMLDGDGRVICGTQSNLFAVRAGQLLTPRLDRSGVAGVMRRAVLQWAAGRGIVASEAALFPADLHTAEELFLTNALIGAWPIAEFDGHAVQRGAMATDFLEWLDAD